MAAEWIARGVERATYPFALPVGRHASVVEREREAFGGERVALGRERVAFGAERMAFGGERVGLRQNAPVGDRILGPEKEREGSTPHHEQLPDDATARLPSAKARIPSATDWQENATNRRARAVLSSIHARQGAARGSA